MDNLTAPHHDQPPRAAVVLLAVIAVILTGWALKATYTITMPLALAFFVAVLLRPIQRRLDARLSGRRWQWVSVLVPMLIFLLVVALFAAGIWISIDQAAEKAPEYVDKVQAFWNNMQNWVRGKNLPLEQQDLQGRGMAEKAAGWLAVGVGQILMVLALITLVFFFVLLMLLEAQTWRDKTQVAFGRRNPGAVIETIEAISEKVRQFLWVRTLISVISGVSVAILLSVMRIDLALLWGFMTFLLNYIPNNRVGYCRHPANSHGFRAEGLGVGFDRSGRADASRSIPGQLS